MSFAVTALVVSAVGAAGATYMGAQAASEQREGRRARSRGQQFTAKLERTKQVREALIRKSQIENQAASQGVSGASGALSGVGSIASQAASNISNIGSQEFIGRTVSRRLGKAQAYQARGELIQGIADTTSLGFKAANRLTDNTGLTDSEQRS
jgi:hypothetical protein